MLLLARYARSAAIKRLISIFDKLDMGQWSWNVAKRNPKACDSVAPHINKKHGVYTPRHSDRRVQTIA